MVAVAPCVSWSPFRDTLKVLEAGIQYANTLASECSRDYDRVCLQMRMSYSPAVRIFLFLMQWTNCSLADAVGLLRILLSVCLCGRHHHHVHPRKEGQHHGVIRYLENTTCHMNSRLLFWRKCQRKTGGTTVWRAELYPYGPLSSRKYQRKTGGTTYSLAIGALLGLSMTNKHGCKKFLLKIGLELPTLQFLDRSCAERLSQEKLDSRS